MAKNNGGIVKYFQLPLTATIVTGLIGLFAAWLNHQYQSRLQAVEVHAQDRRTEEELASIERRAEAERASYEAKAHAEIEATQIRAIGDLLLGDHRPDGVDGYVELMGVLSTYGKYALPTLMGLMGKDGFDDDDERTFDVALERSLLSVSQVFDYEREVGDAMMAVLTTRTPSFSYRAHLTAIQVLANIEYLDAASAKGLGIYRPHVTAVSWKSVEGRKETTQQFCCALSTLRQRFDFTCPEDAACTGLLAEKGIQCL